MELTLNDCISVSRSIIILEDEYAMDPKMLKTRVYHHFPDIVHVSVSAIVLYVLHCSMFFHHI